MANPPTLDAIDPEAFNSLLEQYPNIVPDKLHALDEQRYDTIPQAIRDRDGPSCLTKEELVTLVEWKLYAFSLYEYLHLSKSHSNVAQIPWKVSSSIERPSSTKH